jgi:hypothetical protein
MHKSLFLTVLTVAVAAVTTTFIPVASQAVAAEPEHKHGTKRKHKLGRQPIGAYTVSVILIGEVEPGEHVDFDIKLIDAKSDPKALRVWIGTQDAAGSMKATGTKVKTTYTGEVTAPSPMPKDAKLWVELETEEGTKSGSFEMEKHNHKH